VIRPTAPGRRSTGRTPVSATWTTPASLGALLDALPPISASMRRRVYVAGMSNARPFAQQLACRIAGSHRGSGCCGCAESSPRGAGRTRPIAVIAFNGTEDACVPFRGRYVAVRASACPCRRSRPRRPTGLSTTAAPAEPAAQRLSEHVRTIAYSEWRRVTRPWAVRHRSGGHTWRVAIGRRTPWAPRRRGQRHRRRSGASSSRRATYGAPRRACCNGLINKEVQS